MKDSTRLPAKYTQGQQMPSNISTRRALGYWSDICWRANFVVGPIENRARTLHEESAAANVGRTRQDRVCRSRPLLDSCLQKHRRQETRHLEIFTKTRPAAIRVRAYCASPHLTLQCWRSGVVLAETDARRLPLGRISLGYDKSSAECDR